MSHANTDQLEVFLRKVTSHTILDGIDFFESVLVECRLNGITLFDDLFFHDSLANPSGMIASAKETGEYLLFTCACGIADDGGWGLTKVVHLQSTVSWTIVRGESKREFEFDRTAYRGSMRCLQQEIEEFSKRGIPIEPRTVFPPE
jgi:hypothetical protein